MMGPTHVVFGLVLAVPFAFVAPEYASIAALSAMAGGVFPDLDMLFGTHRKTLHFPAYYWVVALPAAAVAVVAPSTPTVAVALFLVAAALHSGVDVLGGATEPQPWEATSDRGVYLHARRRWVAPRRWIRYDGAPEDFALAVVCAVPGLVLFEPSIRRLALGLLVVGAGYAVVRKRVPQLSGRFPGLVARVPGAVAVAATWLALGLVGRFGRR